MRRVALAGDRNAAAVCGCAICGTGNRCAVRGCTVSASGGETGYATVTGDLLDMRLETPIYDVTFNAVMGHRRLDTPGCLGCAAGYVGDQALLRRVKVEVVKS